MSKKILLAMLAILLAFGLALLACDNGSTGSGRDYEGEWINKNDNSESITITGDKFTWEDRTLGTLVATYEGTLGKDEVTSETDPKTGDKYVILTAKITFEDGSTTTLKYSNSNGVENFTVPSGKLTHQFNGRRK